MAHVLIVGAGSLGQVYGQHLVQAGDELTFLVKEKYEADTRAGFTMFELETFGEPERARFEEYDVITQIPKGARFDEVWLAVPADALEGAWLDELLAQIGAATLVVLQPGIEQRELVLSKTRSDRVVFGVPAIVSYPAPLHDEVSEAGTAYYLPPLGKTLFSGPRAEAKAIITRLRRAGMGAAYVRDAVWAGVFPTAVLITHVAALELCGWSFARAAGSEHFEMAAAAARETMAVAAAHLGRRPPRLRLFVRPAVVRFSLWLARRLAPFDPEAYLRLHFTKTGSQTRALLDSVADVGRQHAVDVAHVEKLRHALIASDEACGGGRDVEARRARGPRGHR